MKTTADEKRTTRQLYNLYKADPDALRRELCKLPPLDVAVAVLELAHQLPVQARERLLGHLRRWAQEDKQEDKTAEPCSAPELGRQVQKVRCT